MLLNKLRIRIFMEFIRDMSERHTGSNIARKHSLNQKSVSNALAEFEAENLLKSKPVGKNLLYGLNFENPKAIIHMMSAVEHLRTMQFLKSNPKIKEIISQFRYNGIVAIFGSYAKDTQTRESDLDLFVAGDYDEKAVHDLSRTYNIDINVKRYPKKHIPDDPLIKEIQKNHILLDGIQEFIGLQVMKHRQD